VLGGCVQAEQPGPALHDPQERGGGLQYWPTVGNRLAVVALDDLAGLHHHMATVQHGHRLGPQLVEAFGLEAAQRVGLRIPDTLITSDPNEARSFVDSYERVVHKAMSPHPDQLLETRRWTEQDRRRLSTLCLAPTIFQEEIRGRADVRITVAGDRTFSARMESTNGHDRVDSRLDLDAHCERYDLPTKLENALLALMRDPELVFGTIDLRIDDDGQHFFLEVNPQGHFLYIEILTGMPIAAAVAKLLAGAPGVEPASTTVHPDRPR
jgi:hypothetical protein